MSFSLFSVAIFLLSAAFIISGIMKGARKGFHKTLFSLASIVASLIMALVASPYISRFLSSLADKYVKEFIDYGGAIPESEYMDILIEAVISMIISSVFFLVVFALFRAIFALLALILRAVLLKKKKNEETAAQANAAVYDPKGKKRGALVGAVCGLLSAVIVTAPVMGTLNMVKKTIDIVESADKTAFSGDILEVTALKNYANDGVGLALYCAGGNLIYSSAASASVRGETVYIMNELENIEALIGDFLALFPILQNPAVATSAHAEEIDELCEHLGESRLFTLLLAEYLPQAASAWLNGEDFMEIEKPELNDIMMPIFNDILDICAKTDIYTVKENTISLLRIYSLLLESGILQAGDDFDAILKCLQESDLLARLSAELDKNANMQFIKEHIAKIALRVLAEQIFNSGNFSSEMLSELTVNLADAIQNIMSGDYATEEEMLADMTSYAKEYLGDYGISVPDSFAEPIAETLLSQFKNDGEITPEEVEDVFKGFLSQ